MPLFPFPQNRINRSRLFEKESFSDRGKKRMKIALRNVDVLLRLTTNLINFERTDVYSSELFIAQYDLKSYLQDVCDTFRSYAAFKHLDFTCDCMWRKDWKYGLIKRRWILF